VSRRGASAPRRRAIRGRRLTIVESRQCRGRADGGAQSRLDAPATAWVRPKLQAGCRDCGSDGSGLAPSDESATASELLKNCNSSPRYPLQSEPRRIKWSVLNRRLSSDPSAVGLADPSTPSPLARSSAKSVERRNPNPRKILSSQLHHVWPHRGALSQSRAAPC
jgi:hypothetical protein